MHLYCNWKDPVKKKVYVINKSHMVLAPWITLGAKFYPTITVEIISSLHGNIGLKDPIPSLPIVEDFQRVNISKNNSRYGTWVIQWVMNKVE